jgi:hypothetical protein
VVVAAIWHPANIENGCPNRLLQKKGKSKLDSSGIRVLTPVQRESLIKRAALIFDVNPVVARIRLDSLSS